MKKLLVLVLCFALVFPVGAFAEVYSDGSFNCDDTGLVTIFMGQDPDVVVPHDIEGVVLKKLDDNLFRKLVINGVSLGDDIEEIGDFCFAMSEITYANIPKNVKTVGESAFAGCKNLSSLYIATHEAELGKDALKDTGKLYISIPCTVDEDIIKEKVSEAKGDDNFTIEKLHGELVPSMIEKDVHGNPVMYCADCNQKVPGPIEDSKMPFTDVPEDSWYFPYVSTAYLFGIINGKTETTFDPNANMTLAEAVKIGATIHAYQKDPDFKFEPYGNNWYDVYVDYCYSEGIIGSHINFDWNKTATRAEMAYIFSRADSEPFEINPDVPLTDIPDVDLSTEFANEILALYRRGIATGSDEMYTFYPNEPVKRSESATFISRIICYDMRVELPKG